MRIVKEAEEGRNEILDVVERLFVTKGFDNTSTNDILNEIGIAGGLSRQTVIVHLFIGSASKASGSLMTVICKSFALIKPSYLHFGQKRG